MPSKKQSKSKLLQSAERSSSSSSGTPSKREIESGLSEDVLRSCVKSAAEKHPGLIGEAAVIGQVSGVDQQSKRCEIWLSENVIGTYYLRPGSLVSVSLAPVDRKSYHLSSLAEECARSYGFGSDHKSADTAGSYFVLATLSSSTKVMKSEVRLSSKLSYSLGSPALGRVVFVFPIQYPSTGVLGNGAHEKCRTEVDHLLLYSCKELYLELVHARDSVRSNNNLQSTAIISQEKSDSRHGDEFLSSPKTPFNQTRFSPSSACQSPSAILGEQNPYSFDASVIHDLLASESEKSLVQTWVTSWLNSRVLLYGNFVEVPFLDKKIFFRLARANGLSLAHGKSLSAVTNGFELAGHANGAFLVDRETEVHLQLSSAKLSESSYRGEALFLGYDGNISEEEYDKDEVGSRLGGLSKEYAILKDVIVSSSAENTVSSLGLRTTKGVLLHGPPGTGKTSLVQQCATDAGVKIFTVRGPEIITQYFGESEKALHNIFDSASRALPALVFIDELDAIAPAREYGGEALSVRIVATLLNLMDGISTTSGLCVVAATNRLETIEPALRRPGRFGREIEIGVPSPEQRADILHHLLEGREHCLTDGQIWELATSTHGYVGADLASLCDEAALVCLKRSCSFAGVTLDDLKPELSKYSPDDAFEENTSGNSEFSSNISSGTQSNHKHCQDGFTNANGASIKKEDMLKVALIDFEKAIIKVRPSAMREVILEVPKVSWEDVGGQEEVKTQLMEAVLWPQKHQDAFVRVGTQPPTGILLFGPPGCSKTLLARAVASEAGLNFLAVKGPELFSKWVGESEKAVKSLFAKARANAPAIIFFDEIDGLAVIRGKESDGVSVSDRVMSQLLIELDGLHERVNVTVIAATNRPDKIDSALLRPGRFDRLLYVGPPNEADREAIFRIHMRKTSCASDVNLKVLAALTEGYTGADISLVCREAGVTALEESIDASSISLSHFRAAIVQVTPLDSQSYQNLSGRFQRLVKSRLQS
uniref:AAA+ ATPase domain-containing protein n=1 Tax=Kalanchoe fedtschenkoi TaxID=63787 RepID=A0A7N0TVY8_KALFE